MKCDKRAEYQTTDCIVLSRSTIVSILDVKVSAHSFRLKLRCIKYIVSPKYATSSAHLPLHKTSYPQSKWPRKDGELKFNGGHISYIRIVSVTSHIHVHHISLALFIVLKPRNRKPRRHAKCAIILHTYAHSNCDTATCKGY